MASSEVYATTDQFFQRIEWKDVPTADETANALALLESCSRAIDGWCNAQDGFVAIAVATAREYSGNGTGVQRIDPCIAVSKVEVKDSPSDDDYTEWAAADWLACQGDPANPDYAQTPYEWLLVNPTGDYAVFTSGRYPHRPGMRGARGIPTVRVTARWGRYAAITDVPNVREACLMQAAIWFKRMQGGGGDTLATEDFGVLRFRTVIDPAVEARLMAARHWRPSIA